MALLRSAKVVVVVVAIACSPTAACTGDDGGRDPVAFCETSAERERLDAIFEDLDPTDVDSAISTFEAARDAEEELRAVAPEAVHADLDVIIRFLDDVVEGLRAPEATAGDRPPVYDELRPRFDQVEAASDRLELYVSTNC